MYLLADVFEDFPGRNVHGPSSTLNLATRRPVCSSVSMLASIRLPFPLVLLDTWTAILDRLDLWIRPGSRGLGLLYKTSDVTECSPSSGRVGC